MTTLKYGWLVFRNDAVRTYEVALSLAQVEDVAEPDFVVQWALAEDVNYDLDYFSFNYLRDPATNTLSYVPYPEPTPSPYPTPDGVLAQLFTILEGNVFELMVGLSACIKTFSDPAYLELRQSFWALAKYHGLPPFLPPHMVANIEHWCRWNAVDII